MGTDDGSDPVSMIVNSSDLRVVDFLLEEVRPLQLDTVVLGVRRTLGEKSSGRVSKYVCTLRGKRQ